MVNVRDLEQAIIEDPEDLQAWLVYADYLQGENDPAGQLIAVGIGLEENPQDKRLKNAFQALFNKRDRIGAAAKYDNKSMEGITLATEWRFGFVRKLELGTQAEKFGRIDKLLLEILQSPGGRFIQEINLVLPSDLHQSDEIFQHCCAALVDSGRQNSVTSLNVRILGYEDGLYHTTQIELIRPVLEVLPNLQTIYLQAGALILNDLSHQKLKRIRIQTRLLKGEPHLFFSHIPKLSDLECWGICLPGRSEANPFVLERWAAPELLHLKLVQATCGNQILQELAHCSVLSKLQTLDLSHCNVTDPGGETLLSHQEKFGNLQKLRFNFNYIGARMQTKLKQAYIGKIELENQRDGSLYKVRNR